MITATDQILIEHEAANADKPWVLVRKCGYQPGFGGGPGMMLYNVVGGEYARHSTITLETLLKQGYRVEVTI